MEFSVSLDLFLSIEKSWDIQYFSINRSTSLMWIVAYFLVKPYVRINMVVGWELLYALF